MGCGAAIVAEFGDTYTLSSAWKNLAKTRPEAAAAARPVGRSHTCSQQNPKTFSASCVTLWLMSPRSVADQRRASFTGTSTEKGCDCGGKHTLSSHAW